MLQRARFEDTIPTLKDFGFSDKQVAGRMAYYKQYKLIISILLAIATFLTFGGVFLCNTDIYYIVLIPLIVVGLLEMYILSFAVESSKAVCHCLLNTMLAIILVILKIWINYPILSNSDLGFGAIIIALYILNMAVFTMILFKSTHEKKLNLATCILAIGPLVGIVTFYIGLQAWIGLAIIISTIIITYTIINQYINLKNSNNEN